MQVGNQDADLLTQHRTSLQYQIVLQGSAYISQGVESSVEQLEIFWQAHYKHRLYPYSEIFQQFYSLGHLQLTYLHK